MECGYLADTAVDGSPLLRHVALFASADAARGRALYGLHLPPQKRCGSFLVASCDDACGCHPCMPAEPFLASLVMFMTSDILAVI